MRRLLVATLILGLAAGAGVAARRLSGPDPRTQAVLDGCRRSTNGLVLREAPAWVYVGDAAAPASGPLPTPRWAHGVVSAHAELYFGAHPSSADLPSAHDAYDLNFNLRVDSRDADLLGGDPAARTGNFEGEGEQAGRLHVERESNVLPMFAWPEDGDRVEVLGSWVWDCGHWDPGGERTELHPYRALWVQRRRPSPRSPYGESEGDLVVSTDATPAGVIADCAHRTKDDAPAFKTCLGTAPKWQDASGDYRFFLPAPPKPSRRSRLVVRLVDAGSTKDAPSVGLERQATGVVASLRVPATPVGRRLVVAKQVFAGWAPMPVSKLPEHVRVAFLSMLVRRAMDPGCPPGSSGCVSKESTRDGQISGAPGEWNVYVDVNGVWRAWKPPLFRARDGQLVRGGGRADVYVPLRGRLRVLATGRECDFGALAFSDQSRALYPCPASGEVGNPIGDDDPGLVVDRYASPAAAVGLHRSRPIPGHSTCPASNRLGCYRLDYRVSIVPDAARRARRSR